MHFDGVIIEHFVVAVVSLVAAGGTAFCNLGDTRTISFPCGRAAEVPITTGFFNFRIETADPAVNGSSLLSRPVSGLT